MADEASWSGEILEGCECSLIADPFHRVALLDLAVRNPSKLGKRRTKSQDEVGVVLPMSLQEMACHAAISRSAVFRRRPEWRATRDPTIRKIQRRGFDPGCRASEFACRARAARHSGKCPCRKRAKEPRPSFSQRRASWRISADGARRACWLRWIRHSSGSWIEGRQLPAAI